MNALWITRMSAYIHSPLSLESAKQLIDIKLKRKAVLLQKYKHTLVRQNLERVQTMQELLLAEARNTKESWRIFRSLVPYPEFTQRHHGASDTVNQLLDIGYHQLTNIVRKILKMHDISAALGLLHVARNSDSAPLAYDLVEMFRADIVDAELLRFLRLKKKPLDSPTQSTIAHFLHEVNERLEKKFYLRDFKACHTYRYYMELQILKFIKAVNHDEVFNPLHLPTRHESRCR